MNHPLLLIMMSGVGVYYLWLWRKDLRANVARARRREGRSGSEKAATAPHPVQNGALPGATPSSARAVSIAVAGALVILALETWGEFKLGLSLEQSRMTALFAAYSIVAAPVIEEIIFRGFLVVESERRSVVWSGALGASLIFAALHPFLWHWDNAGFTWALNAKGWFSTIIVFVTSLWLYAARLGSWNSTRSLLPCFAAHAAKNTGVVIIKGALGFLGGDW
jgi:membrane protease YdiL (CAAX protease family)